MATSISSIKGMNPELAAKLKAQGITNTDQLVAAAGKAGPRRDLAKQVGVSGSELLELVNRADLARIKGIGDAYANLLEDAGVDSVKELAHRVPANLHDRMRCPYPVPGDQRVSPDPAIQRHSRTLEAARPSRRRQSLDV